ncbi:MAG: hypothetical protein HYX60_00805, partial [Legionella longbeachae]|nr:hypothetical protein [Legionella longbeachae]
MLQKEIFMEINKKLPFNSVLPKNSFFDKYQLPMEKVIKQQNEWLEQINKETENHCIKLSSIGLGDRVNYFKIKPFIYQDITSEEQDIIRLTRTMDLPHIVDSFDINEKNTLFSSSELSTKEQDQEELNRVLDLRLYPTIKQIIKEKKANIFLGSKPELQVYSASLKEKLIIEIEIPSSVKFYLALDNVGDMKVYIANIVSHENLIQQLITLKLADINLKKIPIIGNTQHYKTVCKEDLITFEKQAFSYLAKKNVLIVAGCSLEDTVSSTLEQIFAGNISKKKFSGSLVSLTYLQSQYVPNLGFIILNLNYGEICEEQISIILEKFNCIGIFSGSAAGYISREVEDTLPEIGTRVPVFSAKNYSGDLVSLNEKNNNLHLHVPTIFFETWNWLKHAKESGASTVDVETYYILKAVQKFQETHPLTKLHIDIGVFISDFVGKKPLRSYENVFTNYPMILQKFVDEVLVFNIMSPYNNNRLSIPIFSNDYLSLNPEKIVIEQNIKNEAVVDCIGTYWDKSEFSKRVHTPVTIGKIRDKESFVNQSV